MTTCTGTDFLDMSKKQQERTNAKDLKELAHYYGSWDALREVIKRLEDNENEAAYERYTSGSSDAWSGGFAENH